MEGPDASLLFDENFEVNDLSGILPRAAEFLFQEIARLQKQFSREFKLEISSLEIYCDNLRDLFADNETFLNLVTVRNRVVI